MHGFVVSPTAVGLACPPGQGVPSLARLRDVDVWGWRLDEAPALAPEAPAPWCLTATAPTETRRRATWWHEVVARLQAPSPHLAPAWLSLSLGGWDDHLHPFVASIVAASDRPVCVAPPFSPDGNLPDPAAWVTLCLSTGCRLTLDLLALEVAALNATRQRVGTPGANWQASAAVAASDWLSTLPASLVGEVHLGGFRWPDATQPLIDRERNQRVSPLGWRLYEHAMQHLGPRPTLVVWHNDPPPLAVLRDEVRLTRSHMHAASAACDDLALA